jgi:cysteine desulfurase/selenocysteine lyase
MSINTTSTSDRAVTHASEAATASETPSYENLSSPASFPDVTMIAKLANEFFAGLPGQAIPSGPSSVSGVPAGAGFPLVPGGVAYPAPMPDAPQKAFNAAGFSGSGNLPTAPAASGTSASSQSPTFGTLTEADFRAIAASLSAQLPLAPPFPPAAPGSTSNFLDGEKAGPWAASPVFPPVSEMHSFPAIPAVPSSPPTAPPSGADAVAVPPAQVPANIAMPSQGAPPTVASSVATSDAEASGPWSAPPNFPAVSEMYSLPRVPGASVPALPEKFASSSQTPAAATVAESVGAGSVDQGVIVPFAPLPSVPADATSVPANTEEKIPHIANSPQFPATSDMFHFPSVPGAQSVPGSPVLPSSVPTSQPSENDLRALAPSVPGTFTPRIPDSSQLAMPGIPIRQDGAAASGLKDTAKLEFTPDIVPEVGTPKRPLDARLIRRDFPILQERVHGRQLIWLDNAATTQKPNAVIDRLSAFYRHENSNIHRAAHTLAARATDAYESAREKTRRFLNASSTREIIFVRGTTEGINLVAQSWGRRNVQKGDEIVITWLEHHANIVPWQQLCSEKGARLRVAPVNDRGEVILEEYEKLFSPRTRLAAFSQVSNALGTVTPAREMVAIAHRHGARVLVDGAQSVSHMRADVQSLDCDFYVFSGHKVFAPTGIGVVYGKLDVLNNMPPWQGGGNMIVDVTFEKTVYQSAPARFEAGTGNIADAVGLGAALDYVEQIGIESIAAYEHELLNYATTGLLTVPGLRLIGTAREKAGVLSFVIDEIRTEDIGTALNEEGIAVRSGHHCAQPILRRFGVEGTVRASLAFYNTKEEIDALVAALLRIQAGRIPTKS